MKNQPQYIFKTRRLSLAAWLHSEGALEYVETNYNPNVAKVEFVFDDPRRMGRDLEDEFDNGAPATSASKLFSSQQELRRAMSVAQNQVSSGEKSVYPSYPANR